jgi:putative ABC transport system permease protein
LEVININYYQLALASILVLAVLVVNWVMQLGFQKDLIFGALRTLVQLSLTGYVLAFIFLRSGRGEWYWVMLALVIMIIVAVYTAAGRTREKLAGKLWIYASSIGAGSIIVILYVILAVLRPENLLDGQYIIPLAGMIIGNSMTAGTLAVTRFASDVRARRAEIETALSLGATPGMAVANIRREALRTAIIPNINSMLVVGIVSLPGMMTGQIIAGQDPTQAVRYQIVVMYMICAAASFTAAIAVIMAQKKLFTPWMSLEY